MLGRRLPRISATDDLTKRSTGTGSRLGQQDRETRLDDRDKAEPPARCTIALSYFSARCYNAIDGNFFRIFGRLHPAKDFPYISLLYIAGLAIIFSFFFKLTEVISAILAMRILVQFIGQAVGVRDPRLLQ